MSEALPGDDASTPQGRRPKATDNDDEADAASVTVEEPPATAVMCIDSESDSSESGSSTADAVKWHPSSHEENSDTGGPIADCDDDNNEPVEEGEVVAEEEDEDDGQSSSSSEPPSNNDQFDQKPSLTRFAFLTSARLEPRGPRRYDIFGDAGLPILRARVRFLAAASGGGCCGRGGGGGGSSVGRGGQCRPFLVNVSDFSSRQLVMRLLCSRHCDVVVESPPCEVIGYVTAERILCSVRLTVRDLHGTARLVVRCPRYCRLERAQARCQPRRTNRVLLADESDAVARLTSAWTATAGSVASHTLDVPEAMSNDLKAMLIGVALLFDRKLFV